MPEKRPHSAVDPAERRLELRGDCAHCVGLCCVASSFSVSADFAIDKAAGEPCPNLRPDFRCGIHDRLRPQGFPGCTVYDCFGAGQQVTQVTFAGDDWQRTPGLATQMFSVFGVMRHLHELLWYLTEALTLPPARSLRADLTAALDETERLTQEAPDVLAGLDVDAHRQVVDALLLRTSALVRAETPRPRSGRRGAGMVGKDLRGADLIGRKLRGTDLRAANLRGAYLLGADLREADLRTADLIGADFRGADVGGADLTTSIFLTQPQLDAAKGNARTRVPPGFTRPTHWPG